MITLNWYFGWSLELAGLVSGVGMGLGFEREDFLGGYASFRRRILRLGHIALAELGILNVLFSIAPPAAGAAQRSAGMLLIVGGITMPAICFLAAWKSRFRCLFFVPVLSLIAAVILVLCGGLP
jgi:hypothetical protein